MKMLQQLAWIALLTGLAGGASTFAQVPERISAQELSSGVYAASGILWNQYAQGSGTVVRTPKTVASAAHVVYDDRAFSRGSAWLGGNYFLARHHSNQDPASTGLAMPLRGFWNFATYGGTASDADFSSDFVVHYAYNNLAQGAFAVGSASDSTTKHPLNLGYQKILVGYPSDDRHYLNSTGPFTSVFRRSTGRHFWNTSVAVVSGMSGGGAFYYNPATRTYQLAGVVVSGNPEDGKPGTGVRAIDGAAYRLLATAAQSAARTTARSKTVALRPGLAIPDFNRVWTVIPLPVSGLPARVEEVQISCSIRHPWPADLEVILRCPARRTLSLHQRRGFGYDGLELQEVVASSSFRGLAANGKWELLVRDLEQGDIGFIDSVALTITAR